MDKKTLLAFLLLSISNIACCSEHDKASKDVSTKPVNTQPVTNKPKGNLLIGDFNGDKVKDTLEFTYADKKLNASQKNIRNITPWELYSSNKSGSRHSIIITHGSIDKLFSIYDVNDISILDTGAAKELFIFPFSKISELELPLLSQHAKGDLIVIPTEAGVDTFLYWDGETYKAYEPIEMP